MAKMGAYRCGSHAAYIQSQRQQRQAVGLCVYCAHPVARFRACQLCRAYQADYKRRLRASRKEAA